MSLHVYQGVPEHLHVRPHRVRRGIYARSNEWDAAKRTERALATLAAVARTRTDPIFTMESALVLQGISVWPLPDESFTTGDTHTPGHRHGVRHSHRIVPERFITEVDGFRTCTVAYAIAELARRRPRGSSVVAIDHALRIGACTKPELLAALGTFGQRTWPRAQRAIAFGDAHAESALESVSRVAMDELEFVAPTLQVLVPNARGLTIRGDFFWPGVRVVGEADGAVKYGELAEADGISGREVLMREKYREDAMRERHGVARWGWADVMASARLERILLAAGVPKRR